MELLERAIQLQALETALMQSSSGQGCVALVYGEAGIGKTSLVDHFMNKHKMSYQILLGACDSLYTPRPLGPLRDIALQIQGNLLSMLDADSHREAIFSTCLNELKTRPTILVIEDVHWVDEATLDLLTYLGRRVRQTASLIILTYRDEEIGVNHPLRILLGDLATSHSLHHIPVHALSKDGVRELAKNKKVDTDLLHHVTNGNPFFVTEVLANEGGIPETVRGAVWVRAARLSPAARSVLEAAAVIGLRIEPWLLWKIVGEESINIDECIARGMLQSQNDYYAFRHELARQIILESIPARRKIVLHSMTLSALKESPQTWNELARLAHHAEEAKDAEAVLEYASAAGRQASAVSSHREAVAQYARALRFANILPSEEKAQLFERRAVECYLTGEAKESITAQREALTLWRELQRRDKVGNCLSFLSLLLAYMGNNEEARKCVFEAIEILETLSPGIELANAYASRSRLHMLVDEDDQAVYWGMKAIDLAETYGAVDILVVALNTVGNSEQYIKREIGQAKLQRSLELALNHNMHEDVVRAYNNLGISEAFYRKYENALRYYDNAIEYASEHDLDMYIFSTKRFRAKVYYEQGRWLQATIDANEVLRFNQIFSTMRFDALIVLGQIGIRRGDPGAEALINEAHDLPFEIDAMRIVSLAVARTEAAWLKGDYEQALIHASKGVKAIHSTQGWWERGETNYWMWKAGGGSNRSQQIESPFGLQIQGDWKSAAEEWDRVGCPYEQAMALMEGDEIAQLSALEIFEKLNARPIIEKLKQKLRLQGARLPRGPRPATRKNPWGLTAREMEVLNYLVKGLSNNAIAIHLSLSVRTVEHHIASVLQKMGAKSRAEATALAMKDGLISSE